MGLGHVMLTKSLIYITRAKARLPLMKYDHKLGISLYISGNARLIACFQC